MYGIPNCDTIKKAKKWLEANKVEYKFHDYKKVGVERSILEQAIAATQIDTVVNKRGTTYRKLSEEQKTLISQANKEDSVSLGQILDLLSDNPSMIKRPILCKESNGAFSFLLGFSESTYQEFVYAA
jgi:Spx/MgsR family transcriptional regulator